MMREVRVPSAFLMMARRSLGSTGVTMRPPSGLSRSSRGPSLDCGQAAPQCTRSYWPCRARLSVAQPSLQIGNRLNVIAVHALWAGSSHDSPTTRRREYQRHQAQGHYLHSFCLHSTGGRPSSRAEIAEAAYNAQTLATRRIVPLHIQHKKNVPSSSSYTTARTHGLQKMLSSMSSSP